MDTKNISWYPFNMYLNIDTINKTKNKVMYNVNDIPVIKYGHFNARYHSRIETICSITKLPQLKYDSLIGVALRTITDNFDDIILQDKNYTRQNIIYYELPLIVDDEKFTLDIAVLLTSSIAKFDYNRPRVVADVYTEYIDKGIIKFREPVICIETITIALRTNTDSIKTYTGYNVIKHIKLDECVVNTNEFRKITHHIRKEYSLYTRRAGNRMKKVLAC